MRPVPANRSRSLGRALFRGSVLTGLILATLPESGARADAPAVAVEAGGAARAAAPGSPAAWTDVWTLGQAGGVTYEGYGQLAWRDGQASNLFLLQADGASSTLRWSLGRQRLVLPSAPLRRLDLRG